MHLKVLREKVKAYKSWLDDHDMLLTKIETAIFQNDKRNIIAEKVANYTLSAFVLHIVFGIVGAFVTLGTSIVISIIIAAISLFASKMTFGLIFGNVRDESDLNDSERQVIQALRALKERYEKEKLNLLGYKSRIYFDYYIRKKEELSSMSSMLCGMDTSKLAKAYQIKFNNAKVEYERNIIQFNSIYAGGLQ